jgi:ribosomal protein S18 acetylase RimI-like enzyme
VNLELESLPDYGIEQATLLVNRGFADYAIRVQFSVGSLLAMMVYDDIDATSSRIVLRDGEAVGIALIARRGWSIRLAGMAIVPNARGQGIGTWFMEQLIAESQRRGERRMVLEVIEQNTAAVRLYKRCGFRARRRLVGYTATPAAEAPGVELDEMDIRGAARMVTMYGLPDLPWQISGESLAKVGPPNIAVRIGDACAIISNPDGPRGVLRAVLTKPDARRQGQASRLLRALMVNHPGKVWTVPSLCPEEIGGLLEKVGFARAPLTQLQMAAKWS